jgi:hypothetical protein
MGFFSNLLNQSQAVACVLPETHPVMRQISGVLGFDVVDAADYESQLVPAINSAAEYLDAQIAAIPGPLDISAGHYTQHPLVHELFAARQDVGHGIGRSMDIKQPLAFLAGADQPEAFALLGVRRHKDGAPANGGGAFCEHTFRSLAATEAGARQGLRTAALSRLVKRFGEHLDQLRHKGQLPREAWNIENRRDLPSGDQGKVVVAKEELQPENLMRGLTAWLQRPDEQLQVRAGKGAGQADTLRSESMPQLLCHDRRRWTVCMVRFPTAEGVAAMQNETRQYRYIRL